MDWTRIESFNTILRDLTMLSDVPVDELPRHGLCKASDYGNTMQTRTMTVAGLFDPAQRAK